MVAKDHESDDAISDWMALESNSDLHRLSPLLDESTWNVEVLSGWKGCGMDVAIVLAPDGTKWEECDYPSRLEFWICSRTFCRSITAAVVTALSRCTDSILEFAELELPRECVDDGRTRLDSDSTMVRRCEELQFLHDEVVTLVSGDS